MPTVEPQQTASERHRLLDELIQVEAEITLIKQQCAELSRFSSEVAAHIEHLLDRVRHRNHLMGSICRMGVPIRVELFLS